jgi:hypothetical protein
MFMKFMVVVLGLAFFASIFGWLGMPYIWMEHRPTFPQDNFDIPNKVHGAFVYISQSDVNQAHYFLITAVVSGVLYFGLVAFRKITNTGDGSSNRIPR